PRRRLRCHLPPGDPRARPRRGLVRPLPGRRPRQRGERVDAAGGRGAPGDPDRSGPGLSLRGRGRVPAAGTPVEGLVSDYPLLSLITATPFVGALLIMFGARRRPAAVRVIAAASATVCLALSVGLYLAYRSEEAGFQFYERYPLVPAFGIAVELGADGI